MGEQCWEAASALRHVWLWYLPPLVPPYTGVMLKTAACLLKKQSGNTGAHCRWSVERNVRGSFVHPPFSRRDQLGVKHSFKFAVHVSCCIRAGTPETEVFLPVQTVLPWAAAVPFAHQCSSLFLRACCEGGITSHCSEVASLCLMLCPINPGPMGKRPPGWEREGWWVV